jgi:hypothetical protein
VSDAIATIERILADAETLPDPQSRALVKALASALVDLVGDGLRRVGDIAGPDVVRQLANDELVGNLLVLTNQHPDGPAVRAERALAAAAKELSSVGIVFNAVETTVGGGLRVRVSPERGSTPDAARMRELVETIVLTRAPDADAVHVDLAGEPSHVRLRVMS